MHDSDSGSTSPFCDAVFLEKRLLSRGFDRRGFARFLSQRSLALPKKDLLG